MSQWSDIQKHVRGNYPLQDDEPDMMSMVWSYDDGRHQKIVVRRYASAGRDHVEFKSPFAREGQVDHAVLLRDNAKLPLGAVALSGEVFLVIHNALVHTLGTDDVDYLLQRIADIADSLEEKYGKGDAF
jgi:hypothetical protein